ncbi:MAG: ATP-binding protein [Planctomycetaceae bacterium]|nr:ATP-binding protein [Planctomycetaceae bacterium]
MKIPPNKPIHLTILSVPAHVPVARAAVERFCRAMQVDEQTTGQIALSLDEALANIIKHAYGGRPDGLIEIEVMPLLSDGLPPTLQLRLRDRGRHVDPARIRSRDLDDVRPGGLGVHIIHQYMDRIEYRKAEGGGTVLTMLKRLGGSGGRS